MAESKDRATILREAREAKFDAWFKGRHWRVCSEISGERTGEGGAKITYDRGWFTIAPPHTFKTPLGHRGRAGILIQEVDAEGHDLPGTTPASFGEQVLKRAAKVYGSVTGLDSRQVTG